MVFSSQYAAVYSDAFVAFEILNDLKMNKIIIV